MSTDYQEYSIDNQRATISKYATDNGYIVVVRETLLDTTQR
jgi:hypothetical protein